MSETEGKSEAPDGGLRCNDGLDDPRDYRGLWNQYRPEDLAKTVKCPKCDGEWLALMAGDCPFCRCPKSECKIVA